MDNIEEVFPGNNRKTGSSMYQKFEIKECDSLK